MRESTNQALSPQKSLHLRMFRCIHHESIRAARSAKASPRAFSLVEVLIVIVIMAILAAVIVPSFFDSVQDADDAVALNNLQNMRLIIERYRGNHHGIMPSATLVELVRMTNANGEIGTTSEYPYGPYLTDLPKNPLNGHSTIRVIANSEPTTGEVTGTYGWLYHPASGSIYLDDLEFYAA